MIKFGLKIHYMVTQQKKKKAKIPELSIILVNYQSKILILECLASIKLSHPKILYEIIVVDNNEKKEILEELKEIVPEVKYIPMFGNRGYAVANNQGSKRASGNFLLFLNPDTIITKNALGILIDRIKTAKNAAIVVPQLLNEKKQIHELQCSQTLTPLKAIMSHSIINKVFPNNSISKRFWYLDWDRTTTKEVGSVEGSALLIKKSMFNKLNGFDEKLFMYFEDTDLCFRAVKSGKKVVYEPNAKIIHYGGKSTKSKKKSLKIYRKSRNYYLSKHFGTIGILTISVFWFLDRWKSTLLILFVVFLLII